MSQIQQAAEYIQSETDKLDARITYVAALTIARHLQQFFTGEIPPTYPANIARDHRRRYDSSGWETADDE